MAVLCSGTSKTVCGKTWIQCYTESSNGKEKNLVESRYSQNIFKFGDGKNVNSLPKVLIPANYGASNVIIEIDVVKKYIPLLLLKETRT